MATKSSMSKILRSSATISDDDVKRRILLASAAFRRLNIPTRHKREINKPMKVRLCKALILPIATYAAVETSTIKIEENWKYFNDLTCGFWEPSPVWSCATKSETKQWERSCIINTTIIEIIKTKRLKWLGLVTRRPLSRQKRGPN